MTPLDSYLARVAHALRALPAQKRDDELRELRSHLEQRTADFASRGLPLEIAQTSALHEFGSPRALGSKLCDAWEGIPFSLWRLGSTLIGITILCYVTLLLLWLSALGLSIWDGSALLPELHYILAFLFVIAPFLQGCLLSRRLGRRGPLITLLYFGCLVCLRTNTPLYFDNVSVLPLHFLLFNLAMALSGSVCAADLHHRSLKRLAPTGGQTLLLSSPTRRKRSWTMASLLFALLCGLIYLRVYTAFHPTTPTGVLRAALLSERGMNYDFVPPTIVELDELPPTTAAERANQQKRVFFRVEVSATPEYAARRIAFLKSQLSDTRQRKSWGAQYLRRSLKRLQTNRQQVEGTARLVRTPQGWKVAPNGLDHSQLGAWCYNIFHEGTD